MNTDYFVLTYERVSTEEQKYTKSCDDQKTENDRHIFSKGWKLAENGDYRDEGISGTRTDRTGLQDLLLRCKEDKRIKAVVVTETDRIARGNLAFITIRETLKKYGVELVAVTQPMVDDTPEGRMIGEILGAVNGLLVDLTRRKSMRALDEKAARGIFPGKARLGYANINIGTEERPERIIDINKLEAPYIQQIPKLYNQGFSYREISDQLYSLGLRGHEGGKVSPNEIRKIIFDDFYLGEFIWRGKRYKGKHTPLFNRIEAIQARNRSEEIGHIHTTKELKEEFLFKLLPLSCPDCGCRITAEKKEKHYIRTNRDATYILYHCTKSKGRHLCRQPSINKDQLIKEFAIKAVKPIDIDKDLADFLFQEMDNEATFRAEHRDKMIDNINRRLGQLESELHKLLDTYLAGRLTNIGERTPEQIYEEFKLKKEYEHDDLIRKRQQLLSEDTSWREKASNFFSLCTDAKNRFLNATEEKQVNFLKAITSNVLLDNKKLVITHKTPFSFLLNHEGRTTMLRD